VTVTAPLSAPDGGRPPLAVTLTVNVALPDPEDGETTSHGCDGVAVHVTAPAPLWVTRTGCADVCDVNVDPLVSAPNVNVLLLSVIVGRPPWASPMAELAGDTSRQTTRTRPVIKERMRENLVVPPGQSRTGVDIGNRQDRSLASEKALPIRMSEQD